MRLNEETTHLEPSSASGRDSASADCNGNNTASATAATDVTTLPGKSSSNRSTSVSADCEPLMSPTFNNPLLEMYNSRESLASDASISSSQSNQSGQEIRQHTSRRDNALETNHHHHQHSSNNSRRVNLQEQHSTRNSRSRVDDPGRFRSCSASRGRTASTSSANRFPFNERAARSRNRRCDRAENGSRFYNGSRQSDGGAFNDSIAPRHFSLPPLHQPPPPIPFHLQHPGRHQDCDRPLPMPDRDDSSPAPAMICRRFMEDEFPRIGDVANGPRVDERRLGYSNDPPPPRQIREGQPPFNGHFNSQTKDYNQSGDYNAGTDGGSYNHDNRRDRCPSASSAGASRQLDFHSKQGSPQCNSNITVPDTTEWPVITRRNVNQLSPKNGPSQNGNRRNRRVNNEANGSMIKRVLNEGKTKKKGNNTGASYRGGNGSDTTVSRKDVVTSFNEMGITSQDPSRSVTRSNFESAQFSPQRYNVDDTTEEESGDGLSVQIKREMAMARLMDIPVRLSNGTDDNDLLRLNPDANSFSPLLQDSSGNRFFMVETKGMCYFHPTQSEHKSNPKYVVATNEEAGSQQTEHFEHREESCGSPDLTNGMQVSLAATNDHPSPITQTCGQVPTSTSDPYTTQPSAAPTDIAYSYVPQVQDVNYYCHSPNAVQPYYTNTYPSPVTQEGMHTVVPMYTHHHIPQPNQYMMATGHPIQTPMGYSAVYGSPVTADTLSPVEDIPAAQIPFGPQPYPVIAAMPNQSPSPLLGYQSIPHVFMNAPTNSPTDDPNGHAQFIQSPAAAQFSPLIYGQPVPTNNQQVIPQAPVMNFQTYWATVETNHPTDPNLLSDSIQSPICGELMKEKGNDHFAMTDNDIMDYSNLPNTPFDKDGFALKVITKFVNAVKRCEKSSASPMSEDELVEKLFQETTGTLFGMTQGFPVVENGDRSPSAEVNCNESVDASGNIGGNGNGHPSEDLHNVRSVQHMTEDTIFTERSHQTPEPDDT